MGRYYSDTQLEELVGNVCSERDAELASLREQVAGLRGLLKRAHRFCWSPRVQEDIDAALASEPESAAGVKVGRYAVHEEDEGAQEPEPPDPPVVDFGCCRHSEESIGMCQCGCDHAPEPECGAEDCPVPPVPGTNYCHAHTGGPRKPECAKCGGSGEVRVEVFDPEEGYVGADTKPCACRKGGSDA